MKQEYASADLPASALIDRRIADLGDWRGAALARMRALIKKRCPTSWKNGSGWGHPCWSSQGILCTGESYKSHVKLTFLKGAALEDPDGCSTPAWTATRAAPSTSTKARRWTPRRFAP